LTRLYRTRETRCSTAFNFGDDLGLCQGSAAGGGWEWSLRFQHFSNAGIERPNPGEDFLQLHVLLPLGSG
jgi:lipid A 3-O-deacylase